MSIYLSRVDQCRERGYRILKIGEFFRDRKYTICTELVRVVKPKVMTKGNLISMITDEVGNFVIADSLWWPWNE